MKNIFLFVSLFATLYCIGQEKLLFDTKYTQSEDKWVAFPPDSIGLHNFGFIYIDPEAGLTFDYAGSFKIGIDGKFQLKEKEVDGFVKYRLEPNNYLVSVIPEAHFEELKITKIPEWLVYYKEGENSIERLYKWGFTYNSWQECKKALEFLEKGYKINPEYKGISAELAYSYNCLGEFENALNILEIAIKREPKDAYINKELIFAQVNNNKLDEAIETYEISLKNIPDTTYNPENAYNILGAYYRMGNLEKFNIWLNRTKLNKDERFQNYVKQMKNELEKE